MLPLPSYLLRGTAECLYYRAQLERIIRVLLQCPYYPRLHDRLRRSQSLSLELSLPCRSSASILRLYYPRLTAVPHLLNAFWGRPFQHILFSTGLSSILSLLSLAFRILPPARQVSEAARYFVLLPPGNQPFVVLPSI